MNALMLFQLGARYAQYIPIIIEAFQWATSNEDFQTKIAHLPKDLLTTLANLGGQYWPAADKSLHAVAAAVSTFDPNLIKWVQKALNTQGAGLAEDGIVGPLTIAAVQKFQAAQGLDPDGWVGFVTKPILEAISGIKFGGS